MVTHKRYGISLGVLGVILIMALFPLAIARENGSIDVETNASGEVNVSTDADVNETNEAGETNETTDANVTAETEVNASANASAEADVEIQPEDFERLNETNSTEHQR